MIRDGVFLAVSDTSLRESKVIFRIYKPNSGLQAKPETSSSLRGKGTLITTEEAEKLWTEIYDLSEIQCVHVLWRGNCRKAKISCDIGLRKRDFSVLSGAVLTVWPEIEKSVPYLASKLQIVRLKIEKSDLRVIGKLLFEALQLPNHCFI